MSASKQISSASVMSINSKPRKQPTPLPNDWVGAVHALDGTLIQPARVLITVEMRETIMFRTNTITDCLARFAAHGFSTAVFEARLATAQPLLAQYHEFCPVPFGSKVFAALRRKSYWVTLDQGKIFDELMDQLTELARQLSQAVDYASRLRNKLNEIATARNESSSRTLYALKKHADSIAVAAICRFAAKPQDEIARCEKLASDAQSALEEGDVDKAKLHTESIGNIRDLSTSVQRSIDDKIVIEVFTTRA